MEDMTMKKLLSALMAVILVLSLAACAPGKPTETTKDNTQTPSEGTAAPTEQTAEPTEATQAQPAEQTLQVPSKEIYFNCPEGWGDAEATYCTVLLETDECLVAVCYNWAIPYEGELEGLVEYFGPGVMRDVASYSKGYLGAATITAQTTEKTTVAGFDSVKFTGTAPNTEWNCHVYGYTMIVSGIPMMVMGMVSTPEQDAAMIAEINALTDQVAASLRTQK